MSANSRECRSASTTEAAPLFLRHARAEHTTFDGYRARIAALRGAATAADTPIAPAEGRNLLIGLVGDPEVVKILPEFLSAFIAYGPDLSPLELRGPEIFARLEAAGRTDDSMRLQMRGIEEFGLNDVPRADRAIAIMNKMRTIEPIAARLDSLVAVHVGDLRFREHLSPFAIRLLQEEALSPHETAIAEAFLRAYARAEQEADGDARRVRQAIAAQAPAWFGAELDITAAEAAAALRPPEAGLFGTELVAVNK